MFLGQRARRAAAASLVSSPWSAPKCEALSRPDGRSGATGGDLPGWPHLLNGEPSTRYSQDVPAGRHRRRQQVQGLRSERIKLASERGISSLWAGAPWRIFRQFCCFLLFDKINSDVARSSSLAFPSKESGGPKEGDACPQSEARGLMRGTRHAGCWRMEDAHLLAVAGAWCPYTSTTFAVRNVIYKLITVKQCRVCRSVAGRWLAGRQS